MSTWLSKKELNELAPAETAACESPVPTRVVSNGEFNPLPQTDQQKRVEARITALSDAYGKKMGMDRREFLKTGKKIAEIIPVVKIIIMVDDDIDLWNPADLFMAFATRWQAFPASHIFEDLPSKPLETSSPVRGHTSKIVIDATRQWPEEGGRTEFPEYSRSVLSAHDPGIFDRVDARLAEFFK